MKSVISNFVTTTSLMLLVAVSAHSQPQNAFSFTLSTEDIASEDQLLKGLGLDLHGESFLSPTPFTHSGAPPRPFIMPSRLAKEPVPREVNADDLLTDLDILEYSMRLQYSGWETAEKRGWNWDLWFQNWRLQLQNDHGKRIDLVEAFKPVVELKRFQPDNHSGPRLPPGVYDKLIKEGSVTALLTEEPSGVATQLINDEGEVFDLNPSDLATQPQEVLLNRKSGNFASMSRAHAISYPRSKGNVLFVVAGGKRIRLEADFDQSGDKRQKQILDLAQLKQDQASYRKLAPDIGYVRMPTMIPANAQGYSDLAANIAQLSDGKENVLVVDLRQNEGGLFYFDHMARWYSADEIRSARSKLIVRSFSKESYLQASLSWNEQAFTISALENPGPKVLATLQAKLDKLLVPKPANDTPTFSLSEGPPDAGTWDEPFQPNEDPYHPILLILVDNGTASNGEAAVGTLAKLPNALVAGVNSFGVGEFGAIGTIVLPHSGLQYRIATSHSDIFRDGRSFEGYGVKPRLLLHNEQLNSAGYISELANSLANVRRK